MLNLFNANGNLDEIVFANRNQAYGAYQIRKQYNVTLTKAVFIMLSAFLLLFLFGLIPSSTKTITTAKDIGDGIIWVDKEFVFPEIDKPFIQQQVSGGSASKPTESFTIAPDK